MLIPGGADFRDPSDAPGGPFSYQRHAIVPVTIQSADRDVASVEIAAGGMRVSSTTGSSCVADGGYCRVVPLPLSSSPLAGMRGTVSLEAWARDDLGNERQVDAGQLTISRWAFSFDGGSIDNRFSMSTTGDLVIAKASQSQIIVLRPDGTTAATWNTTFAPVGSAAVGMTPGQSNGRMVYVLESDQAGNSRGEAFFLDQPAIPSPAIWAPSAVRAKLTTWGPVLRTDPMAGNEEVVAIFRDSSDKPIAAWAALVRASGSSTSGTRISPDTYSAGGNDLFVVASGGQLTATDGNALFGFSGLSMTNFVDLQERGNPRTQSNPGITSLIGLNSGDVVGLTRVAGTSAFFRANFPATIMPSTASTSDRMLTDVVFGGGTTYFVPFVLPPRGRLCRSDLNSSSFTCTTDSTENVVGGLALGASGTLYDVAERLPSGPTVLQVRTASSLALQTELPLPAGLATWTTLTPTCINGEPVIGATLSSGLIVFLSTDARGIDTSADWPMRGHDPSATWNTSTPLTGFACP